MIWPRVKFSDGARSLRTAMGSVTSALNRSRNTVVQLTSEPAGPPRVASRKPRTFKSRTKATTAATVEVRKFPPVSGAWEGSGRPAAVEVFQELSDVLMSSETEERALGLVLSPPRRSRSACEYNLVFVYIIIYIHIKKYNHGRGKENIDFEMLLFLVLFI